MNRNTEVSVSYNFKIFKGLQEFIDSHTSFSNLELSNFQTLLVGYFAILSFIFVTFCLHHLIAFLKKNRIHAQLNVIVTSVPRTVRVKKVRAIQKVQRQRNRRFRIFVPKFSKFNFRFRVSKAWSQRTSLQRFLKVANNKFIKLQPMTSKSFVRVKRREAFQNLHASRLSPAF